MIKTQKLNAIAITVLSVCFLIGCGKGTSSSNETTTQTTPGKLVSVNGQVKLVLVRGEDFSFTAELFFVSGPNIYHLTFDPECKVDGGSDSTQDGDGYPKVIGGKHFLLHSGATYQIEGEPLTKGVVLSTRPTIPLRVTRFACVSEGAGTSYAYMGWKKGVTTWAPPEALKAGGIFVNDSEIIMRVEGGQVNMGGGKTIDINSVAPWAEK